MNQWWTTHGGGTHRTDSRPFQNKYLWNVKVIVSWNRNI